MFMFRDKIKHGLLHTIELNQDFLAQAFKVLPSVGRSVTADREHTVSGNEFVLLRYTTLYDKFTCKLLLFLCQ